ncbi:MAG: hypothetical protein KDB90_01055 [Planctomycetes bacterium]|nr:hypothetical protein [Planctomycetota bacterium]
MAFARFVMLVCAITLIAISTGCASQTRTSQVGEVGFNPRQERELAAEKSAQNYYDYITPKAGAVIRSNPAGALVEWYNGDGTWVAVGNTPTEDIVIEATGKPELFRVSAPGFLPQIRWVATTPNSEGVVVSFELDPELPSDRYYLGD